MYQRIVTNFFLVIYHFSNQLNYFTQKQSIAKKVLVEIMINIAKTDNSEVSFDGDFGEHYGVVECVIGEDEDEY